MHAIPRAIFEKKNKQKEYEKKKKNTTTKKKTSPINIKEAPPPPPSFFFKGMKGQYWETTGQLELSWTIIRWSIRGESENVHIAWWLGSCCVTYRSGVRLSFLTKRATLCAIQ
jgi:hypothetical protein